MSLKDKIRLINRHLLSDERGWFLKVMTGKEEFLPKHVGEIYMTLAKPGEWRANHFHTVTAEWFTVFQGNAKVILEDIETKERSEIYLTGESPQTLYVPPRIAHVFANPSEELDMILVTYAENGYDPDDTTLYNLIDK